MSPEQDCAVPSDEEAPENHPGHPGALAPGSELIAKKPGVGPLRCL